MTMAAAPQSIGRCSRRSRPEANQRDRRGESLPPSRIIPWGALHSGPWGGGGGGKSTCIGGVFRQPNDWLRLLSNTSRQAIRAVAHHPPASTVTRCCFGHRERPTGTPQRTQSHRGQATADSTAADALLYIRAVTLPAAAGPVDPMRAPLAPADDSGGLLVLGRR